MMARRFVYWMPRVLGLLYVLLISLFALDVFWEDYNIREMVGAFLLHLLPAMVVLVVLGIAWRWEKIGGAFFILLGSAFVAYFEAWQGWANFLLIPAPLYLIGVFFLIAGFVNTNTVDTS